MASAVASVFDRENPSLSPNLEVNITAQSNAMGDTNVLDSIPVYNPQSEVAKLNRRKRHDDRLLQDTGARLPAFYAEGRGDFGPVSVIGFR